MATLKSQMDAVRRCRINEYSGAFSLKRTSTEALAPG